MSETENDEDGDEGGDVPHSEQSIDDLSDLPVGVRNSTVSMLAQTVTREIELEFATAISPMLSPMIDTQDDPAADLAEVSPTTVLETGRDGSLADIDGTVDVASILPDHEHQSLSGLAAASESTPDGFESLIDQPEPPEPQPDPSEAESVEEQFEKIVEELLEIGFIVQCDHCSRRVLYENSHQFVTNDDGETVCGACRSTGRSFG